MVDTPGPALAVGTPQADTTDPMMARLKFTLTGGLVPQNLDPLTSTTLSGSFPDTGALKPWVVKAGTFACNVESDFAVSAAEILQGGDDNLSRLPLVMLNGSADTPAFYSKPMQKSINQAISSKFEISIHRIGADDTRKRIARFEGVLLLKKVPSALYVLATASMHWVWFEPDSQGASANETTSDGAPTQRPTIHPVPRILQR